MKKHFISYLLTLILCMGLTSSCSSNNGDSGDDGQGGDGDKQKISYSVSQDIISNPERGFMHSWQVNSEGPPVDKSALESLKDKNVTLILRLYYLEKFKNTSLSTEELNLMEEDMSRIREAGIKCVLRFAYTDNQEGSDAPLDIIETHLDQLKPFFENNQDVIAFVQAGFIGAWGEWYFSSNGLATTENRKAVLEKMLEVIPENIKIQVRTPLYKQHIFEYSEAMNAETGYGVSDIARVGFHNDCFLASSNDYGTYEDVETEKAYISKEALFVPTGGETCPPTDVGPADCNTAETEMKLLKWTYLNLDYYGPVLNGWRNADCFDDFQRKLGYRLVFRETELDKEVSESFNLNLRIENLGFAPVYSKKKSFLILRSVTDDTVIKKELETDVRKIIPGNTYDLSEKINISNIPSGDYELLLEITDHSESLQDRPEYHIRMANTDTWEADSGYNRIGHTIIVK
ncbi:DUF4832 domain-containing protein [Sinomicrobium soli]|uniref:DUF4832 domain-containing protein n=1 Tax=Sinomicrobium sp. N-1-3-6 TaxID=2219864 RepID=UPI000DCC2CC0|nr:DUF4832 domain-containing protein [Sinomicrobium sp. N-1-3-6]RAV27953.1 hypothetical protein DN748_16275 [Sinomicrobium sp. N-1-3-6]